MKNVSSVAGYNAVIIGGPMYMGKVIGDVGKFVRKHRDSLSKLPVAAFTVGLAPVSKDPAQVDDAMKMLRTSISPLQPVAEAVFAGRVDPTKFSFIQRKMTEMAKSPVGDFRDWDAIAQWAREIPAKMGV